MNQKLIDTFTGLRNHIDLLQDDANKAATGNKAAGTRLRKGMQQAKVMCQEIRQAVSELQKNTTSGS